MGTRKKKITLAFVWLALFFAILVPESAGAKATINAKEVTLFVGEKLPVKVKGTKKKIKWVSSDKNVAKVTKKGVIKARSGGKAVIKGFYKKKKCVKCKVTVNETFKLSTDKTKLTKTEGYKVYLAVDGSVSSLVKNPDLLEVNFGKWDGDFLHFTIKPLEVGKTTITFTNSVNSEVCKMDVVVKYVPVEAEVSAPVTSNGSENLICGENTVGITYVLKRDAEDVKLEILDENGYIVRTMSDLGVIAKKEHVINWDGCDDEGKSLKGVFTYRLIADKTVNTCATGCAITVVPSSPFVDGDGSKENPYLVSNAEEFKLMTNYNGCYFKQDSYISFDNSGIKALFSSTDPFVGCYDGNNYAIGNICNYNSLFGYIGEEGVVKNVQINNGLLMGDSAFIADGNKGKIDNCMINGEVDGLSQAALIVVNNTGDISGCHAYGKIVVSADVITSHTVSVGGICVNNAKRVTNCSSSVEINSRINVSSFSNFNEYNTYAGGIVGANVANGIVRECMYMSEINASCIVIGGDQIFNVGKIYTGYVAGKNNGHIGSCNYYGIDQELPIYCEVEGEK